MKFPLSAAAQRYTSQPLIFIGCRLLRVCVIVVPGVLQWPYFSVAQRRPAHVTH